MDGDRGAQYGTGCGGTEAEINGFVTVIRVAELAVGHRVSARHRGVFVVAGNAGRARTGLLNQQVALTGIVGELTAADILRFALRLPRFADDGISAGLDILAGLNKRRVGRNGLLRVVNKRVGDGFCSLISSPARGTVRFQRTITGRRHAAIVLFLTG